MVDVEEVERVRKYAAQVDEISEANVCHFIVTPLLLAAGYGPEDISIQSHQKNSGTYPDYTILGDRVRDQENISFPWFIEVKAQGVQLTPQAATQACNYAHSKGRRWTVLTNGLEWHLYDVNLNNVEPSDKVILKMRIAQEEFTDLLEILSYQSVPDNLVEAKIKLQPLKSELRTSLKSSTSGIIKTIAYALRSIPSLSEYTEEDIVTAIDSLFNNNSHINDDKIIADNKYCIHGKDGNSLNDERQMAVNSKELSGKENDHFGGESRRCSLRDINNVTHSKPLRLEIGANYSMQVSEWTHLLKVLLIWICENKKKPTDLGEYLHHSSVKPSGKKMQSYIEYIWNGEEVYIDTNNRTEIKIEMMKQLCMDVGLDQTDVNITFKYRSK